jgi:recombinational DNA repair protein (RecF pathway)
MWEANERRLERELARRPVCSICENPIQDEQFYNKDGEYICKHCMETQFLVDTEDYIE